MVSVLARWHPRGVAIMRTALLSSLLVVVGCGDDVSEPRGPEPMTVMTFNVLCSLCKTAEYDPWEERLEYFRDIFARHDPDIVGIQELTPLGDEVAQMLDVLPGRAAVYFEPDDALPYPDAIIFYKRSRFSVLDRGEYWLSPTPEVANSTGFASPQLARLVVWAKLRDRAGDRDLLFVTTHFDNNSPSQTLSAPLVKERTAPFAAELPVVVTGDFNSKPGTEAWVTLTTEVGGFALSDTQALAAEWGVVTNQEPAPDYALDDRIDHVFVGGTPSSWTVSNWNADLTTYGAKGRYPSDHFPITTTLDYR